MSDPTDPITYADAGVDIDAGNALVDRLKPAAKRTSRPGTMSGLGGFGALFDLKAAGFDDPVLVAATDGVGTKLRVAIESGELSGVGRDLVAMCVNDLICQGAEPLFFLDYFATGKLDVDEAAAVIEGIADGCVDAGCALIGGETAEMPGMYAAGDFDLAGFAVGAMERGTAFPKDMVEGDILVGISSSGVHSNGYSLVRKVVEREGLGWSDAAPFANVSLGRALLEPTRIYVRAAKAAMPHVKGFAHITGGGVTENLPRVLPEGLGATVDLDAWTMPPVFNWLIAAAGLDETEALKTFNCGLGMIAVVAEAELDAALAALTQAGETPVVIGRLRPGNGVSYSGTLS